MAKGRRGGAQKGTEKEGGGALHSVNLHMPSGVLFYTAIPYLYIKGKEIAMAKFIMREMHSGKAGEGKRWPHLLRMGEKTIDDVASDIAHGTTFAAGEVKGIIGLMVESMAMFMGYGYTVRIEGLGSFWPTLRMNKGTERETTESETLRSGASVHVGAVLFRAHEDFLDRTDHWCRPERIRPKKGAARQPMTEAERIEALRGFLQGNPFVTVRDYMRLTGLKRTAATEELRRLAHEEGTFLDIMGRDSHRVYVLRQEGPAEGQ